MTLRVDVVIPTFNRGWLLERTLDSIASARVPTGLEVTVIVVDNNSTDDTETRVRARQAAFPVGLQYRFERAQGRSHALNAGIAASDADLIGMIDDDEEIADDWFEVIGRCFHDRPDLDFIGGPYRGNWQEPPPSWLPHEFPAVLGVLDGGPDVRNYVSDSPSILPGGNAVVRRRVLLAAGPYDPGLGRSGNGLFGAEDVDMFRRLLAIGATGEYRPDLIIYHHIPPERLTRSYFRRWAYAHGRSLGIIARRSREPVPHLLGLPRYRIRSALHSAMRLAVHPSRWLRRGGRDFADEIRVRQFAGQLVGRWLDSDVRR